MTESAAHDSWLGCPLCEKWRLLPPSCSFLTSTNTPFDATLLTEQDTPDWSCYNGCSIAVRPTSATTLRWTCNEGDDYSPPVLTDLPMPPLNRKVSLDAVGKIKVGDRTGIQTTLFSLNIPNSTMPRKTQETFGDGKHHLHTTGFSTPLLILKSPTGVIDQGFGLKVPDSSFTIASLLPHLGPDYPIACIDCKYQSPNPGITTLKAWCDYMSNKDGRTEVNNLISLEFTNTSVAKEVRRGCEGERCKRVRACVRVWHGGTVHCLSGTCTLRERCAHIAFTPRSRRAHIALTPRSHRVHTAFT